MLLKRDLLVIQLSFVGEGEQVSSINVIVSPGFVSWLTVAAFAVEATHSNVEL